MNIQIRFNDFHREPKKAGMYFVIFRIDREGYDPAHDYGFCDFGIDGWAEMDGARVVKWAELPPLEQPKKSLIIT